MAKYTPGPWRIAGDTGKRGEKYVWTDRDEEGKGYVGTHEVCVAIVQDKIPGEGQCDFAEEGLEATARLIAAAPALFLAWSLVPAEMKGRIFDALHHLPWAEEAIRKVEEAQ